MQEDVVVSILEHTTDHGAIAGKTQTNKVKYYNLDAATGTCAAKKSGKTGGHWIDFGLTALMSSSSA